MQRAYSLLTVKSVDEDKRIITGIATTPTPDRMGDVVEPSGAEFQLPIPLLWQHRAGEPIGHVTAAKVTKDGIRVTAQIARETEPGRLKDRLDEAWQSIKSGLVRGLSIGFKDLEFSFMEEGGGMRFIRWLWLELSAVTIPANGEASIQAIKALDSSLLAASGRGQGGVKTSAGVTAHRSTVKAQEAKTMKKTIAEQISAFEATRAAKSARMDELMDVAAEKGETLETDAKEEYDTLEADVKEVDEHLVRLRAREKQAVAAAVPVSGSSAAAASKARGGVGVRHQKEVKGLDLIVRAITARGVHAFGKGDKSIDRVLDELYPGHEATAIVTKADQTIGTTTVAGWASEIVQTTYADFMQALIGFSVYPELRSRGVGLSFDGNGSVIIPSRTAGGAGGGFVAEGAPIRVGRITTASLTVTPRKLGVIVPFSKELAKRSTPSIEALVRQAILEDTGAILDAALLDATAVSTSRPAGLLNGVAATAVGFGGGDYLAVIEDFKALLAPFYAANAADSITVIMNPAQALALSMMPGPGPGPGSFGWAAPLLNRLTIIESTRATAGRLIAIRNSDFVTALGDTPEFDVSEQATVHMEDTTPLEIVSGVPTVADPVRSFWQTNTVGVRFIMQVNWVMRRTGMVSWINQTSW